ncbi:MAG: hypothetical protein ACK4JF_03665, partial [Methylohalobius sp.]
ATLIPDKAAPYPPARRAPVPSQVQPVLRSYAVRFGKRACLTRREGILCASRFVCLAGTAGDQSGTLIEPL